MVMVGDPMQLPPHSSTHKEPAGGLSLMQRFHRAGALCVQDERVPLFGFRMLSAQYRMHPTIGEAVSRVFYGGSVSTDSSLYRERNCPWPLVTVHVDGALDEGSAGSFSNTAEAGAVVQLVSGFLATVEPSSIAVLSFYSAQVTLLQGMLATVSPLVRVASVDSMQGHEADVVIITCTRVGTQLGFLTVPNRVNVALSRAKECVVVVGCMRSLTASPLWNGVLQTAVTMHLDEAVDALRDFHPARKQHTHNEDPATTTPAPPQGLTDLRHLYSVAASTSKDKAALRELLSPSPSVWHVVSLAARQSGSRAQCLLLDPPSVDRQYGLLVAAAAAHAELRPRASCDERGGGCLDTTLTIVPQPARQRRASSAEECSSGQEDERQKDRTPGDLGLSFITADNQFSSENSAQAVIHEDSPAEFEKFGSHTTGCGDRDGDDDGSYGAALGGSDLVYIDFTNRLARLAAEGGSNRCPSTYIQRLNETYDSRPIGMTLEAARALFVSYRSKVLGVIGNRLDLLGVARDGAAGFAAWAAHTVQVCGDCPSCGELLLSLCINEPYTCNKTMCIRTCDGDYGQPCECTRRLRPEDDFAADSSGGHAPFSPQPSRQQRVSSAEGCSSGREAERREGLCGGTPREERTTRRQEAQQAAHLQALETADSEQLTVGDDCPFCGEPYGTGYYSCLHRRHAVATLPCCLCDHFSHKDDDQSRQMRELYPGNYGTASSRLAREQSTLTTDRSDLPPLPQTLVQESADAEDPDRASSSWNSCLAPGGAVADPAVSGQISEPEPAAIVAKPEVINGQIGESKDCCVEQWRDPLDSAQPEVPCCDDCSTHLPPCTCACKKGDSCPEDKESGPDLQIPTDRTFPTARTANGFDAGSPLPTDDQTATTPRKELFPAAGLTAALADIAKPSYKHLNGVTVRILEQRNDQRWVVLLPNGSRVAVSSSKLIADHQTSRGQERAGEPLPHTNLPSDEELSGLLPDPSLDKPTLAKGGFCDPLRAQPTRL